ncbi:MAG: hypothetical protein PUC37_02565 [Spirochaetales bacterium]|nr:hypothetical protein [Spirochaetales bacterium]
MGMMSSLFDTRSETEKKAENARDLAAAKAVQKQAEAVAKAQEQAADAAFVDSMAQITFSGDPEEIGQDFEIIYQYWMKKDLKKDQKKVVADKLELGLLALKKADSMKADFYENKINEEKKKRKTIKIIKIIGGVVGGIIALIFFCNL